jgi:hypothetical protein
MMTTGQGAWWSACTDPSAPGPPEPDPVGLPDNHRLNGVALSGFLAMVASMSIPARLTHRSAATDRRAGGQWISAAVPAVLRPACWWALLIGAPPRSSN